MHLSTLTDALAYAYKTAADAHLDDRRYLNGEPYIMHPLRVERAMQPHDYPARIVALLHDVIEDHPIYAGEIESLYREFSGVLSALDHLTRRPEENYGEYITRLAYSGDPLAIRVKLADLQDNMRDLDRGSSLYRRYSDATVVLGTTQRELARAA